MLTNYGIRSMDIIFALCALILFAIPMLLIAIVIYLEDRRPILFRQPRIGRGIVVFEILKFRTMFADQTRFIGTSDSALDLRESRARFVTTSANDPRITKVGRFLRPLHLDELPQLFNVLKGDMSIVGVRPDVPVQEADYPPEKWRLRHMYRPGITGVAQVAPDVSSMDDRTEKDLIWVRERSMALYLKVLIQTVGKVAKRNSL